MTAFVSMHGLDLSFLKDSPSTPPAKGERARKAARSLPHPKRSALPCPMIISDKVEYRSMMTGEMITSRSQHRDHLKRHGVIEVGEERPKIADKDALKKRRKKEIKETLVERMQMHKQGYREQKPESAESHGFTNVNTKGVTRAEVPATTPKIIV